MNLDPLLYDVQFDSDTGEMSFYDKAGGLIYSCVVKREKEEEKPLTLEALEDGSTVALTRVGTDHPVYQTSLDGGTTWNDYSVTAATPITLNTGEKVCFRIKTLRIHNQSSSNYVYFRMTGKISASGNCYSMLAPDFKGITDLTDVPNATFEARYGLYNLFYSCTSLVEAPVLPATTLADHCYNSMFSGCTSLVEAPVLPATTLAEACYRGMFSRCTSLVEAPVLPATTLAEFCYYQMFYNCKSLVEAPVLPATTLAGNCYSSMFSDCKSLVKAPVLPATTLAKSCYYQMFYNCKSLVEAPVLPATTLAQSCYSDMFSRCSTLAEVTCHATGSYIASHTTSWLDGVSETGDFYADPSAEWSTGVSGIPKNWVRHDIAELEA